MKILLILLVFSTFSLAAPQADSDATLKVFSKTQLTWWGFKIYKAEVWTPDGQKPDFDKKVLLHIDYQKNIKSKSLVETTEEEWDRLELKNPKARKWLLELAKIWPDVKSGDSITTVATPDKTSFYQGKKLLGSIDDKEFGEMFLSIWLHKKTKTPELRVKFKK